MTLYIQDSTGSYVPAADDVIVHEALRVTGKVVRAHGPVLSNPRIVKQHLQLRFADLEHEVFVVLFLSNRHKLIKLEEMFRGTIDGASVYPREVVKRALQLNAAAVIFAHNHPSGLPEPSQADELITRRLKEALALVDVRVLDHLVIGTDFVESFAERGLL